MSCQAHLDECSGTCVNIETDNAHCGQCMAPSEPGTLCSSGSCAVNCQDGLTNCSETCVNLLNDNAHCGACGEKCPAGTICSSGKCELSCLQGLTECTGLCVNLDTDRDHCGACEAACEQGQVCSEGTCSISDTETEHDIYVYDLTSEVTTHESLNSADENGSFLWGSNSFTPTLTTDGRFVGFLSAAQNLDTPDITIENFHAYVKDVDTRALTRVSRHNGGTANCDGEQHASGSGSPRMDSTGNIAVFQSSCAFDLPATEPADVGGFRDVFLRDIAAETTRRLSLASTGDEADGDSDLVAMSDDAHYVLFSSQATNLVPDDTNGALDLFVHDTTTSTTTRVSLSHSYEQISEGVVTAAMSRNGDHVLFTTQANLLPSDTNVETDDLYMVRLR